MRVAIFIDGKNFYSGWKERVGGRRIDLRELAAWIVRRVGGSSLWGAYYFTSVETGAAATAEGQVKLGGFLDMLEMQPGYFVERFPRKAGTFQCPHCGADNRYMQEKEVDTAMVADIVRLAAVGAFDILVLVSGDADYAPALDAVRLLGRQAYVATWGGMGLSYRLRKTAFEHIDMLDGLEHFDNPDSAMAFPGQVNLSWYDPPVTLRAADVRAEATRLREPSMVSATDERLVFLDELRRAEDKFYGGYVGANYFVTRWASDHLPDSPDARRHLLDQLVDDNLVIRYEAPDGKKAIRLADDAPRSNSASTTGSGVATTAYRRPSSTLQDGASDTTDDGKSSQTPASTNNYAPASAGNHSRAEFQTPGSAGSSPHQQAGVNSKPREKESTDARSGEPA